MNSSPTQAYRPGRLKAHTRRVERAPSLGPSRPRTVRCSASKDLDNESEIVYKDSASDIAFINMCRRAYGNLAGWQSSRGWDNGPETYAGMIEVSRALMRGKTAKEQRDAVIAGFPAIPPWFRRAFPFTLWGAELNARITPAFFTWLVGPMETAPAEIESPSKPGEKVTINSAVYIKKCRYLKESGCVGMCINLCKTPTEYFFNNELGMPLYMKPNFKTMECQMIFGQRPPPLDQDPDVYNHPCYAECPTARVEQPRCHKMDLGLDKSQD